MNGEIKQRKVELNLPGSDMLTPNPNHSNIRNILNKLWETETTKWHKGSRIVTPTRVIDSKLQTLGGFEHIPVRPLRTLPMFEISSLSMFEPFLLFSALPSVFCPSFSSLLHSIGQGMWEDGPWWIAKDRRGYGKGPRRQKIALQEPTWPGDSTFVSTICYAKLLGFYRAPLFRLTYLLWSEWRSFLETLAMLPPFTFFFPFSVCSFSPF